VSDATDRPAPARETGAGQPRALRDSLIFVGTYTEPILFATGEVVGGKAQGIYVYRMDGGSGALRPCGVTKNVPNPSYLAVHPSRRFLYAVNELTEFEGVEGGGVSAFALEPESGDLTFLNRKPSLGINPCHLTVDRSGRFVLVTNYGGGNVCVLPIQPDGSLGDPSDVVQHHGSSADPARQAGPHAHAVNLDHGGRLAFVCDLGLDRVMIYRLDTDRGTLTPHTTPWAQLPAGAGPRQLVMSPQGRFAYVISELNSTLTAFRYDAESGTLREIQTLSTLPDGFAEASAGGDVQISPTGDRLYASNRGHDSIVTYAVDQASGRLTPVGHDGTLGRTPRSFAVDPAGAYTLVANQDSDNIVVFRNDPATGRLIATGQGAAVPTPVCIKVLHAA
jgi:6-phosphogluconolactonase